MIKLTSYKYFNKGLMYVDLYNNCGYNIEQFNRLGGIIHLEFLSVYNLTRSKTFNNYIESPSYRLMKVNNCLKWNYNNYNFKKEQLNKDLKMLHILKYIQLN